MARENVGHIDCPLCKTEQPVRKDKNDALYINCSVDGLIQPKLPGGQSYLLEHTRWLGTKPKKEAPAEDAGKADDKPPAPKSKPARRGPAQPQAQPTPPAPAQEQPAKGWLDDL